MCSVDQEPNHYHHHHNYQCHHKCNYHHQEGGLEIPAGKGVIAGNDHQFQFHCAQFKRGPKIFRKGTKRGPDFEQKGDLKGTKRGPKRGPKTRVDQKIEKRLHVEIFQKLNLDEEKTMSVFLLPSKQTNISLINNF